MPKERKHAAIMFTDIVGYTALMGSDEDQAFKNLRKNREIHTKFITQFKGTLIKEMGDGMLISFDLASDAVRCGIEIQKTCKEQIIPLKIGIHEGEMVFEGNDVLGDGVNIASRIQDGAEQGCIMISGAVYRDIKNKSDIQTEFVGEKNFKNVDEPIKIYQVVSEDTEKHISINSAARNRTEKKSIIVLPFENISPDRDQEYFSDGLTEEIITDLSHIHDLLVISRSSAMTFKGSKKKIKEIVREVNVRYVLEGSVRKAGNNLRITAQLIDGTNDSHLWAEKYNGTLDDVFDIQEKVSRSIVDALKFKLSSEEKKELSKRPISNVQAYECFLKAKNDIYSYTKEGLDKGIKTLQNGLELFGENAILYATLGEAYYLFYDIGYVTDVAILDKAEEYAKKTLALEPQSAYGYKLLALLERGHGSLKKACRYIKKAYEVEPNESSILLYSGMILGGYAGQISLSKSILDSLLEVDPLTPLNYGIMGFHHYYQGQFVEATELISKSIQMAPEFTWFQFWLATVYVANNELDKAIQTIDQTICEEGIDQIIKDLLQFLKYVILGDRIKALNALGKEAKAFTWNDPDFSYLMPGYYALLNEKEEAYRWMEHAIERDFFNFPFYQKNYLFLENIRGELRFKKLMERVKREWEDFKV